MIVEPLLPFYGAPNFNAIADKPFYHKRRFVISAPKTVKHIDQQNVKRSCNSFLLQLLHGIPVFGGFFET